MYRFSDNIVPIKLISVILISLFLAIGSLIFYKMHKRINSLEYSIKIDNLNNKSRQIANFLDGDKYIDLYHKSISEHMLFDFHTVDKDFANFAKEDLDKLEQICTFKIGQERDKIYLAKAFQCLAKINQFKYNEKDQIFKSIRNISQALDIFYLPENIATLVKSLVIGFEDKIPEKFQNLTKFFTGYKKDEIPILNELANLNIQEITARVNYRLAMIHILGRSSVRETAEPNFRLAIEEIKQVFDKSNLKSDNILDIVIGIDNSQINATMLTIASALLNADITSFYRFHIINLGSKEVDKELNQKLEALKNIRDFHFSVSNLPPKDSFTEENNILASIDSVNQENNLYKLYLDKLFPGLETVLSLNSGSLILKDLTYFKQIEIKNYFIAAVIDLKTMLNQRDLCRDVRDFYINSGVVFFNLNKIRQENNSLKINSAKNCDFAYPEQDMLNIMFKNRIFYVSPRWNNLMLDNVSNKNEPVSFIKNYHEHRFITNDSNKKIFKLMREDDLSQEEIEILHYQEMIEAVSS